MRDRKKNIHKNSMEIVDGIEAYIHDASNLSFIEHDSFEFDHEFLYEKFDEF